MRGRGRAVIWKIIHAKQRLRFCADQRTRIKWLATPARVLRRKMMSNCKIENLYSYIFHSQFQSRSQDSQQYWSSYEGWHWGQGKFSQSPPLRTDRRPRRFCQGGTFKFPRTMTDLTAAPPPLHCHLAAACLNTKFFLHRGRKSDWALCNLRVPICR